MPIKVQCPNADCKKVLSVPDEYAGKKVRCPGCKGVLSVPAPGKPAGVTAAAPPKAPAAGAVSARPAKAAPAPKREKGEREVTVFESLEDATLDLAYDADVVTDRLRSSLEKRLAKKDVELTWVADEDEADVLLHYVRVVQGNQFMRWLIPFSSPAVVEIDGEVNAGGKRTSFHYVQKAHIAMLGGPGKYMLNVCCDRLAKDLTREIQRLVDRREK